VQHKFGIKSIPHGTSLDIPTIQSDNVANDDSVRKNSSIFHRILRWPTQKFQSIKQYFRSNLPMLQYLWPKDDIRLRIFLVLSMVFMFLGKWFTLRVPFLLQQSIDAINKQHAFSSISTAIVAYGLARAFSVVFAEIKTCLFIHVSQNVLRKFATEIFNHLHNLSSDFHLNTSAGILSVAYVRAIRGFQTLLFQLVFSVAPTFLELFMVLKILFQRFHNLTFCTITFTTFTLYLCYTIYLTQQRVALREEMVEIDNARNGFFIDSLTNQELVKLFNNQAWEMDKFQYYLQRLQQLNIKSTYSIAYLNVGQAFFFAVGLIANLLVAAYMTQSPTTATTLVAGLGHRMSVGDVIAVNAMLMQLSVPFNFMGYTCK
jgi:ATP-binding cassette, subfamily B, heavy metal transporter